MFHEEEAIRGSNPTSGECFGGGGLLAETSENYSLAMEQ